MPVRRCSCFSSLRMRSRSLASRLLRGSSSSRILGSTTRLRASATRCCWPPDSSLGKPVLEARQIDQRQRRLDPCARLARSHAAHLQAEYDVLEHRLVRPHGIVLEHHAHAALLRRHHLLARRDQAAVGVDGAGVGRHEAGDQPERRGLAAAARPEQGHELVVGDVEREVADCGEARIPAVALGQAAYADPSHQADAPARTAPSPAGRAARPVASQLATSRARLMMAMLTMASAATGSV